MRVSTEQYDIKISGTLCLSDSVMYIVCLHTQICHVYTMKALWSTRGGDFSVIVGTLVYCASPAEEPFWALRSGSLKPNVSQSQQTAHGTGTFVYLFTPGPEELECTHG